MNVMVETHRLTSVAEALSVLLNGLEPVAPARVPVWEAVGLPAAETVVAPHPVPARPVAQRSGIAVSSAELIGASAHAPAMLTNKPQRVRAGRELPDGADAVLPADALAMTGAIAEIGQTVYPGENATPAGADFGAGAVIVGAGGTITPAIALALETSGISDIAARAAAFYCADASEDGQGEETPHRRWLRAAVAAIGGRITSSEDEPAHAILAFPDDPEALPPPDNPFWVVRAGLALRPGSTAEVVDSGLRNPAILFPPRFDGVVACFYALVLPLAARLTARTMRYETRPLARKIASQVGFTDIALLRGVEAGYEPLAVGQVTLSALIAADAVALIPPESEGAAAGAAISAIPMHDPLTAA